MQEAQGGAWFRVIAHERNRGPAAARNSGWNASTQEFVAFLDADDSWHPEKLAIQYRFMQEHPEFQLTGHLHVVGGTFVPRQTGVTFVEVRARQLLTRNRFVTPSVMVRRTLSARFRDGQRHMEDHLLWMQLALDGQRVARIELALASLYKPQFGAAGQSGDLFAMEAAELGNYRLLYDAGKIGGLQCVLLMLWSGAKFLRRLLLVSVGARRA